MSKIADKLLEAVEKLMEKCREKQLHQTMFYIKVVTIPVAAGVLGAVLERGDGEPTAKDKIVGAVYIGTGLVIAGLCVLPAPVIVPVVLAYDNIAKALKQNKNETETVTKPAAMMHASILAPGKNIYDFERKLAQHLQAQSAVAEQAQPRQKAKM